jgi:gamma-glutamyl-gamma-aminobutyrate hydrolase PuuD
MRTVYTVGGYVEYMRMFEDNGWSVVDDIADADLVQFCGGSDVDPSLYGERKHYSTGSDLKRDKYESAMYELAFEHNCAIAGICRGAQFVHVMNGGGLYQDVNNHATLRGHRAYVEVPELMHLAPHGVQVSSTHHQMMKGLKGTLLLSSGQSTWKEIGTGRVFGHSTDIEAVYHEETNSTLSSSRSTTSVRNYTSPS